MIRLLVGNDNAVRVRGLREASTGSLLNNQSLTGSVRDAQGAALASPVSFTLSYTPGSDGEYIGTVPYDATLVDQTSYLIFIDINAGPTLHGHLEIPALAAARREST